jgi:hypothetical protein
MRLNSLQLERLIKAELNRVVESKRAARRRSLREASFRPSLMSVIFEDVGDDIEAAYSKGPAAVRNLANSYSDKEELKSALAGDFDGEKPDDVVGIGMGGSAKVGDLMPTQSEIDLVKSIGWPLCSADILEKMITSNTSTAPGSITTSGNLILDGHHRWSGIWAVSGKGGQVSVDDVGLKGSQAERLAASQLAIAAYKSPEATQPAAADPIELNILGKNSGAIYKDILAAEGQKDPKAPASIFNPKYLEDCSKNKTIAGWAGFKVGDDVGKVKDAIAKKTAENLSALNQNPDAPARADMPQFDHDDIGGKQAKKDIFAGIQSGEFNVLPPFKQGGKSTAPDEAESNKKKQQVTADSWNRQGAVVVERWQRLAGLIK